MRFSFRFTSIHRELLALVKSGESKRQNVFSVLRDLFFRRGRFATLVNLLQKSVDEFYEFVGGVGMKPVAGGGNGFYGGAGK